MRLDVSLLETVSVLFTFDVPVFHLLAFQAFFLPVELKVNVAGNGCDGQILLRQFHYFTLDVFIFDIV